MDIKKDAIELVEQPEITLQVERGLPDGQTLSKIIFHCKAEDSKRAQGLMLWLMQEYDNRGFGKDDDGSAGSGEDRSGVK